MCAGGFPRTPFNERASPLFVTNELPMPLSSSLPSGDGGGFPSGSPLYAEQARLENGRLRCLVTFQRSWNVVLLPHSPPSFLRRFVRSVRVCSSAGHHMSLRISFFDPSVHMVPIRRTDVARSAPGLRPAPAELIGLGVAIWLVLGQFRIVVKKGSSGDFESRF